MNGQIIRIISNLYTVRCGEDLYGCTARGKFRKDNISPIVGDNVLIDIEKNVILDILPRKNELKRPVVSNVDKAFIITSVKKPDLDLVLLDKLICMITGKHIIPVIIFTKLDLLDEKELDRINDYRSYYEMIGIKVLYNNEVNNIKKEINNSIVVLAGQTGAGKSSLINRLDESLNVKTDEISVALGRGKHTTRHVELFNIGSGYIVDTPGFSSLDLELDKEQLKDSFIEFRDYECKFKDCLHKKERDCAIKDAVLNKEILESRYNNYLMFLEEIENESRGFIYK